MLELDREKINVMRPHADSNPRSSFGYSLLPTTNGSTSGSTSPRAPVADRPFYDGSPADEAARAGVKLDKAKLAAGRAVRILSKMQSHGPLEVSRQSVYGIALVMPQIARSAGWPRSFLGLAVRNILHLGLNISLQVAVLYQVSLSLNVMAPYSSQMHLCSFGAHYDKCPGTADCIGPGGTQYTKSSLISDFAEWHTRVMVKNALLTLAPDRAAMIEKEIHPGEYGMESELIRLVMLFLFVTEIYDDACETYGMLVLLYRVPSKGEAWLSYHTPDWTDNKELQKAMLGHNELDFVRIRIRGMPMSWKIANIFLIILPKIFIWFSILTSGVQLLMETAPIGSLIINGLAIGFIIQIDELIGSRLCTAATRGVMDKLEGFAQYDAEAHDGAADHEVMEEYDTKDNNWHFYELSLWMMLLPRHLLCILGVTALVYWVYFLRFCYKTRDGSYISEDVYPPMEINRLGMWMIDWLLHPSMIVRTESPSWSMPEKD